MESKENVVFTVLAELCSGDQIACLNDVSDCHPREWKLSRSSSSGQAWYTVTGLWMHRAASNTWKDFLHCVTITTRPNADLIYLRIMKSEIYFLAYLINTVFLLKL